MQLIVKFYLSAQESTVVICKFSHSEYSWPILQIPMRTREQKNLVPVEDGVYAVDQTTAWLKYRSRLPPLPYCHFCRSRTIERLLMRLLTRKFLHVQQCCLLSIMVENHLGGWGMLHQVAERLTQRCQWLCQGWQVANYFSRRRQHGGDRIRARFQLSWVHLLAERRCSSTCSQVVLLPLKARGS